jgi:hypothetical protein
VRACRAYVFKSALQPHVNACSRVFLHPPPLPLLHPFHLPFLFRHIKLSCKTFHLKKHGAELLTCGCARCGVASARQEQGLRILSVLEMQLRLWQVRVHAMRVIGIDLLQQLRHAREVLPPVQKFLNPKPKRHSRTCRQGSRGLSIARRRTARTHTQPATKFRRERMFNRR